MCFSMRWVLMFLVRVIFFVSRIMITILILTKVGIAENFLSFLAIAQLLSSVVLPLKSICCCSFFIPINAGTYNCNILIWKFCIWYYLIHLFTQLLPCYASVV